MIVKDEAHIIHESLNATLPLIDTYCIVDTGSSDDTIQKIRNFYSDKGISGEVHERPWKNFGHNRSEALKLCDGKMDYILVIDADDLMGFPSNGKKILTSLLEKESPNGAQILIKQETIEYWRSQIFKANDAWKYVGVLHEYPSNGKPNCKQIKLPKEFWMESRRLGGRNREGNKMERDIAVLTKGLQDEPDNERYMFYLAQSYKDNGNFEQALKYYKKRFKVGKWAEEAWYSAYRVGECYKMLKNIPKFEYWMQKAHAFRPWRAEPIYQLTEFFRVNSQIHKAYHYAEIGRKIGYPKDDVLFVEKFPHEGGFDYECSILDYYIQTDKKIGLRDSINYLLKRGEHIQNVVANMKFYITSIASNVTPLNISNPFGEDFRPSAISIIDYPLASVRFVNYLIPYKSDYRTKDGSPIQTHNAIVNLETGEVVQKMIDDVGLPRAQSPVKGIEDIRIYKKNSETWFTATNYKEYSPHIGILNGKYNSNGRYSNVTVVKSPTSSECEKNWVHIPDTELTIYSWSPYRVGRIEGDMFKTVTEVTTPPLFSLFRGSASPIRVGNDLIALVHFVEYCTPRNYYHCFVKLDSIHHIPISVSLPFVFQKPQIEFSTSMRLVGQEIECFASFFDATPSRVRIPISSLEWITVNVSDSSIKSIVEYPPNKKVCWDGLYSRCYPGRGIRNYISSKKVSAKFVMSDGVVEHSERERMMKETGKDNDVITDYDKVKDSNIIITLCSRGVVAKNIILCPFDDETFDNGLSNVVSGFKKVPWEQRKSVVFWRGGSSGFDRPTARARVVDALINHPNTDVKLTKWGNWESGQNIPDTHFGDRCDLNKHFEHKYIMIIDGNCIASNHQWVFGSGAVPIMVTHPDNDYWFKKFLKPMENYVPIKYDLSDLKEKIDWLVANDSEARRIAENALNFSDIAFTPEFQRLYIDSEMERVSTGDDSMLTSAYTQKCSIPSDINEHLPTLYEYSKKCDSIVECGVRHIVSSYAFSSGLLGNKNNSFTMIDPFKSEQIDTFLSLCNLEGINAKFIHASDIECPLIETDMLFIDTWHIYGQLKRELAHWNSSVKKYIIMHDTTVDEWKGETVRCCLDANRQSKESGIPVEEITKGLWPAIEEFLKEHPEWKIERRYTNNNGLTILARAQ